jgi:hypothetical protein
VVSPQHPGETFRCAIDARRVTGHVEGRARCSSGVSGDRVALLFTVPQTGAVLTCGQAAQLAAGLLEAAQ